MFIHLFTQQSLSEHQALGLMLTMQRKRRKGFCTGIQIPLAFPDNSHFQRSQREVLAERGTNELSQGTDERATKTGHLTGLGMIKEEEEENESLREMGMGHGVRAQARFCHQTLLSSNATDNYL